MTFKEMLEKWLASARKRKPIPEFIKEKRDEKNPKPF
jgi:hypothetical protein